jgi:hypothetical protein
MKLFEVITCSSVYDWNLFFQNLAEKKKKAAEEKKSLEGEIDELKGQHEVWIRMYMYINSTAFSQVLICF